MPGVWKKGLFTIVIEGAVFVDPVHGAVSRSRDRAIGRQRRGLIRQRFGGDGDRVIQDGGNQKTFRAVGRDRSGRIEDALLGALVQS